MWVNCLVCTIWVCRACAHKYGKLKVNFEHNCGVGGFLDAGYLCCDECIFIQEQKRLKKYCKNEIDLIKNMPLNGIKPCMQEKVIKIRNLFLN